MRIIKPALITLLAAFAVAISARTASATPMGSLDTSNCLGGGVQVTATTIDWTPLGAGGCIGTGIGTSVDYTGGNLGSGELGTIQDLNTSTVFPVTDFMSFSSDPNLHFDLTAIGPGSTNTVCPDDFNAADVKSCSVSLTSPFILTITQGDQTSVSLTAFGTARDSTGSSLWEGSFTTQISEMSPYEIQQYFLTNPTAHIESTHSGDFHLTATPIPEPASLMLLGTGLFGAAIRARKRRSNG